jgi:hypothetical protein
MAQAGYILMSLYLEVMVLPISAGQEKFINQAQACKHDISADHTHNTANHQ